MSSSAARPRVRMTGAQRRQQLLDVGRELFAQKGYEATSIEEIAAWSGMSAEARRAVMAELPARAHRVKPTRRGGRAGRRERE